VVNKVSVLSIPYDDNSSFLKGPAKAPKMILESLLSGSLNKGTENGVLLDWGSNIELAGDVEISKADVFVSSIENRVNDLLAAGNKVLSLGGDHSVSYPIVKAFASHYPNLHIVHLDAHSDLYHEFKGNPYSNACPFARIMESNLAVSLHQYGIRTLTQHQIDQAEKFSVNVNQMKDWPCKLPEIDGPVYLSVDIDAIDPAFAPGVSHREPGGLTSREVINLIHQLKPNLVGADIVEYNPDKDIDNITSNLSAKLVKEIAGKMLENGDI
jgi:agmatinase